MKSLSWTNSTSSAEVSIARETMLISSAESKNSGKIVTTETLIEGIVGATGVPRYSRGAEPGGSL